METKEQRIRRKFRQVINTYPEFEGTDKKVALNLICDWFKQNQREITEPEFEQIIRQSKIRA